LAFGTNLDLNGHTISCTDGLKRAIRMGQGRLYNGTIANCEEGLHLGSGATVEHMVFTHNFYGVVVEGGHGNTLRNNTAVENNLGFALGPGDDESGPDDNVLMNNLATRNSGAGFGVGKGRRNRLLGNTASFNGKGFALGTADFFVSANVAEENLGPGFEVTSGYGELAGNTARRNGGEGFVLASNQLQQLQLQGNVAHENGGDGFLLPASFSAHLRVLRRNVALHNGEHGIHVVGDDSPRDKLVDNMVVGHVAPFFDLTEDTPGCRGTLWRANQFETASQGCIH
jgi:parallel beta-helix repeat protein